MRQPSTTTLVSVIEAATNYPGVRQSALQQSSTVAPHTFVIVYHSLLPDRFHPQQCSDKLEPYLCMKGAPLKVYARTIYHALCLLQTAMCCNVHSLFINSPITPQKKNMFWVIKCSVRRSQNQSGSCSTQGTLWRLLGSSASPAVWLLFTCSSDPEI